MRKLLIIILLLITFYYEYKQPSRREPETKPEVQVESVHSYRNTPTPAPKVNTAIASWYDRSACADRVYGVSCKTANGEVYDETKYTTACASRFRLGSRFNICYLDKCVVTLCNDRGNFESLGRQFDLSPATFGALADLDRGIIKVRWELIE